MSRKKILILGHARHGKDTVAEMIEEVSGYTHKSSSVKALEIFLFDVLRKKYGLKYKNQQEAFEDRYNHRDKWFNEISDYNKDDKSRLAKEIMKDVDMYVGLRSAVEVAKCVEEGVFDLVLAVYDPRKDLESAKSFDIDIFQFADQVIMNKGDLNHLKKEVIKFCHVNGLLERGDSPLVDIVDERLKQIQKFGQQNRNMVEWAAILSEETGEVAKEAVDIHFRYGAHRDESAKSPYMRYQNIREELIQVAAVAVAAVEDIDENHAKPDPAEEYYGATHGMAY